MAAADPFPIYQSMKNAASYQTQPFDIDLLCAKLEVAKLEQDAARARQRLHQLTGGISSTAAEKEDRRKSMVESITECQDYPQRTDKLRKRFSPDPKKSIHPKQLFTAVSFGKPAQQLSREASAPAAPTLNTFDRPHDLKRSSTGDVELLRSISEGAPKRRSVAFNLDQDVSPAFGSSQRQSTLERPGSRDMANRRSKTFPLPMQRLPLKHRSMSNYESTDSKELLSKNSDRPGSPMGLVNEYCISFDLADMPRDQYNQDVDFSERKDRPKSQRAEGLRSRSLLSLPLLLKKDRTVVKTEEVTSPLDESPLSPRPATAYHARQKSLPIGLGVTESVERPKLEQRQGKRRSFIGWLKKI